MIPGPTYQVTMTAAGWQRLWDMLPPSPVVDCIAVDITADVVLSWCMSSASTGGVVPLALPVGGRLSIAEAQQVRNLMIQTAPGTLSVQTWTA